MVVVVSSFSFFLSLSLSLSFDDDEDDDYVKMMMMMSLSFWREKNLRTKVEGFRVSIEKKRQETVLKPGRDTTLKTKKE